MAAAGSSRFAVTCGLLRQYMREQQQLGGLDGAFRLPPPLVEPEKAEETDDGRTMQLFPTRAGTSSQQLPEAQAKAPLTIFYEGRMLVFEDFPADRAKELMKLAGSGSTSPAPKKAEPVVPENPASAKPSTMVLSELPIARKASLQRFLQKRKHRISASEPYAKVTTTCPALEKDIPAAGKPVAVEDLDKPAASWLGL